jgi:hypothetical protein
MGKRDPRVDEYIANVDTAVEWMADGKSRNWKYEKR